MAVQLIRQAISMVTVLEIRFTDMVTQLQHTAELQFHYLRAKRQSSLLNSSHRPLRLIQWQIKFFFVSFAQHFHFCKRTKIISFIRRAF